MLINRGNSLGHGGERMKYTTKTLSKFC